MKRRWLFGTLLAVVLAVGITGGAVLAQEADGDADSPLRSFVSRVATILGLEEATVQDAFDQAAKEMEDEALQRKLDRWVAEERLTQEQADEYAQWYRSRPDSLSPGFPYRKFGPGGFGSHGGMKGGMWRGRGWHGKGFWKPVPPPGDPDDSGSSAS